ncbi:MAG: hypothetical protein OHK0013_15910 [Sandaracinaceae bacterium]
MLLRSLGVPSLVLGLGAPGLLLAQDAPVEAPARAEVEATTETPDLDVVPPPPSADPEPAQARVAYVPTRPAPRSREEVEEEEMRALEEDEPLPPTPDPEWRLRAGAGVAIPLNGASQPFLRLHQDLEWHPLAVAPFFFGIGGAQYLVPATLGAVNARVGGAAWFCADGVVRCQGTVALTVGALLGQNLVAFDMGGEADARFLFGALELSLRVGFGGGGGYNFVYGQGGIGAAF